MFRERQLSLNVLKTLAVLVSVVFLVCEALAKLCPNSLALIMPGNYTHLTPS